jgi:phosphonate transport system ATP-binding protein
VILINNLSLTYPSDVKALASTSLIFRTGEFTVLLGPSGAGKSSLLRCLNLLNVPSTGQIHVDGLGELKTSSLVRRHRLRTGMVFQQHQLIGRYSAFDNVLAGRIGYHGVLRSLLPMPWSDKILALTCLEQVGLADKALQRIDCLSGGEQQRVGIARALAQQPKLILADEPVASLDPATANHVLALLHDICKEQQLTTIVSLHQVHFAKQFADRIIGLASGRVLFDGTADDLSADILERIYSRPPRENQPGHAVAVKVFGTTSAQLAPLIRQ